MYDRPTAGITRANLSLDPLATEEEQTFGPDTYNPYNDPNVSESRKREMDLCGYAPIEDENAELPGVGNAEGQSSDGNPGVQGRKTRPQIPDALGDGRDTDLLPFYF